MPYISVHTPPMNRCLLRNAIVLATVLGGSTGAAAQRPSPEVVEYGLPSSGAIVTGRLVSWDYWALRITSCVRTSTEVQCTLAVGNGSDDPHTICLRNAALKVGGRADSAVMSIQFPQNPLSEIDSHLRGYACGLLDPHSGVEIALRSKSSFTGNPRVLAITLAERLNRNGRDSTLEARAEIPVKVFTDAPISP
jgi:hypothetical protein